MKILSCKETRELEQRAVDYGKTYAGLMETAGAAVVCYMRSKFAIENKKIVILCGKGNNGGDGFVIAHRLWEWNAKVTIVLLDGLPQTEIAKQMLANIRNTTVRTLSLIDDEVLIDPAVLEADFIVDAVYGIGFHGTVPEAMRPVFYAVNNADVPVVSVDIPSGLHGDTGKVEGVHIKADHTITFSTLKPVHLFEPAKASCGKVMVASVGIDEELIFKQDCVLESTTPSFVNPFFRPRDPNTNKGSYGRLLALCGSEGMAGAAVLAGKAAVRCGTGLVHLAVPRSIYPIAASQLIEPIYTLLEDDSTDMERLLECVDRSTACLLGCGLGLSDVAKKRVYAILSHAKVPLVIDADGINVIAQNIDILKTAKAPVILTPHPGEMARLLGITAQEVQESRLETVRDFARKYHVILVLKGHNTLTAIPGEEPSDGGNGEFRGKIYCNPTGNAGMAKGGSGDVLAGMIAAFCSQGAPAYEAAVGGVYLHGLCGDRCAAYYSERSMTPSDMVQELPALFLELKK